MTIIAVTRVGGDGSVLNRMVDSASREDAARWEHLAADAHLDAPPPYRPRPGEPVYHVDADGHAADVSEQDLTGPLRDLVTAVIAEGGADGDLQPPVPRDDDLQPPVPEDGDLQRPVPEDGDLQPPVSEDSELQPPVPQDGD